MPAENTDGPGAGDATDRRTRKTYPQDIGEVDPGHADATTRGRELYLTSAIRVLTLEVAAAIEMRSRITAALRVLKADGEAEHAIDVLEGRRPW